MPHVVLDFPDPRPTLDTAIAKQFADIQRQLMGLVKSQQDATQTMRGDLLDTLRQQQQEFTKALARLLGAVERTAQAPRYADGLLEALRGLRQTLTTLPATFARTPPPAVAPVIRSNVTVTMPEAFVQRIDHLEAALLNGLRRSRSRTFGSNY